MHRVLFFYILTLNFHFDLHFMSGNAWLIKGDGTGSSPKIDCTTSEIAGMEPRHCPSGYFCKIQEKGDESQQIPNRGICIRSQTEG